MGSAAVLTGCRQDMQDQPREFPQRSTTLFADGRSARPQVVNTVARSQNDAGSYFLTGMINGKEGDGMPLPVNADLLARGQERYNVYCTACHSRVGNGGGVIVQHGYRPAGNFHTDRLRQAPLGHFFNVMTNGYGAMPDYAAQVTPEDRWAIAAYIRALQLSQHATQADVKAGTKVEKLSDVAEHEGLPRDFAAEWTLPVTAVYGTPNNQDNGIPGQDSVTKPTGVTEQKPAATPSASPAQNAPGSTR
jgi:mono/diheme cytochrome c family protein